MAERRLDPCLGRGVDPASPAAGSAAPPACFARGAASPVPVPEAERSTPSICRSSVSACRPMSPSSSALADALAGSFSATAFSAAACTTIRLTRCATTSCISRAIRARSAARARSARSSAFSASSSSSRSRPSARSRRLSTSRRRARTYSPNRTGGAVRPKATRIEMASTSGSPSRLLECRTLDSMLTKATSMVPRPLIPANSAVSRRGTSDAARV